MTQAGAVVASHSQAFVQESRGTLFSVLRDTKSSDLPRTVLDAFPSTTGV